LQARAEAKEKRMKERDDERAIRIAEKQKRMEEKAARPPLDEATRQKLRKERLERKQAADDGWTVIKPSKTIVASAPAADATMPDATIKKKTAEAFPFGKSVTLMPVAFAEMQNRKSTVGWHIGIAPMGFLVADASSGGWSQFQCIAGPNGSVILESVHTPAFHLAVRKDGQLTHKGGRGRFAQFIPMQVHKFWAFKCAGHETDMFLACSSSGLLYAATELGNDTRFKVDAELSE